LAQAILPQEAKLLALSGDLVLPNPGNPNYQSSNASIMCGGWWHTTSGVRHNHQ
jgi:hypothetical protein